MPFAVVAGATLQFESFAEGETLWSGEEVESSVKTLLSTLANPKRTWTGTTRPYTYQEMAAVRSATVGGQTVTCSGDAFQGLSPVCTVKITAMPYERAKRRTTDGTVNTTDYEVRYTFNFRQA
jgi:hypothetical protein